MEWYDQPHSKNSSAVLNLTKKILFLINYIIP